VSKYSPITMPHITKAIAPNKITAMRHTACAPSDSSHCVSRRVQRNRRRSWISAIGVIATISISASATTSDTVARPKSSSISPMWLITLIHITTASSANTAITT
jgi:hypothetical protein